MCFPTAFFDEASPVSAKSIDHVKSFRPENLDSLELTSTSLSHGDTVKPDRGSDSIHAEKNAETNLLLALIISLQTQKILEVEPFYTKKQCIKDVLSQKLSGENLAILSDQHVSHARITMPQSIDVNDAEFPKKQPTLSQIQQKSDSLAVHYKPEVSFPAFCDIDPIRPCRLPPGCSEIPAPKRFYARRWKHIVLAACSVQRLPCIG